MKTVEQFCTELNNYKGITNWFRDINLSNDRLYDFWYGGIIICFEYGKYSIMIKAIGDVECMARIKNIEDEKCFKNKSNGSIGQDLRDYGINKDSEITFDLLEFETNPKKLCYLDFVNGNNNWVEVIAYDNENHVWLENYESFTLKEVLDMGIKEIIDFALDYKDKISK